MRYIADLRKVVGKRLLVMVGASVILLNKNNLNVPKVGHRIKEERGMVSKNTKGLGNARDLIDRDIWELRRVYPDIPNSQLKKLIAKNKRMYP